MDFKSPDLSKFIKLAQEAESKKSQGKSAPKGMMGGFDPKMIPMLMQMAGQFLSFKIKLILSLAVCFMIVGVATTIYGIVELITYIVEKI